jgi:hypothetical protein
MIAGAAPLRTNQRLFSALCARAAAAHHRSRHTTNVSLHRSMLQRTWTLANVQRDCRAPLDACGMIYYR